jgi:hypothetical protein
VGQEIGLQSRDGRPMIKWLAWPSWIASSSRVLGARKHRPRRLSVDRTEFGHIEPEDAVDHERGKATGFEPYGWVG